MENRTYEELQKNGVLKNALEAEAQERETKKFGRKFKGCVLDSHGREDSLPAKRSLMRKMKDFYKRNRHLNYQSGGA